MSVTLDELRVENLVLIEQAVVRLSGGLNVITGETGAGKTMLAKALDLLLGARAARDVVRPGADYAYVEGTFTATDVAGDDQLTEILADSGPEVVLARRVSIHGRSRCMINGRTVTLEALRAIAQQLVSFYGQHEQRTMMLAAAQVGMLDDALDGRGRALRTAYTQARTDARSKAARVRDLKAAQAADDRQLDLLRFEAQELADADPQPGELAATLAELRDLESAQDAHAACAQLDDLLTGEQGVLAQLTVAAHLTKQAKPLADIAGQISALHADTEEVAAAVARLTSGSRFDPQQAERLHARAELLGRLERKHRCDADELPDKLVELQTAVAAADDRPAQIQQAAESAMAALAVAQDAAAQLTGWRTQAATQLADAVNAVLPELAMPHARFAVDLQPHDQPGLGGLREHGAEQVTFSLQANPGLPVAPIADVASGGEASRLLLALIAQSRPHDRNLLVLDEPDSGIGGDTAHGVADRLARIAETRQVLIISHLPQLAARADRHVVLRKDSTGSDTRTTLEVLDNEDAVLDELCRMAGLDADARDARASMSQMRRRATA